MVKTTFMKYCNHYTMKRAACAVLMGGKKMRRKAGGTVRTTPEFEAFFMVSNTKTT